MHRPRVLRRVLIAAAALPLVAYLAVAGSIAYQQRSMLYRTGGQSGSALAAITVSPIPGSQQIALTTADGERIAGWYIAPPPGQPVMLFLHGQGGRLDIQTNRWRRIREAGYGLLAISYRGYPGSSGKPTEEGLAHDARAAYDWLVQRHAPRDVVVHGHSLGSGVAVRLAAEVEVGAVVLEAPFTAAVDVAAERFPWLPVRLFMLDQFRSRDLIGKLRAPLLIVHGERDSVIPIAHGDRLFALAPEPKAFVRMPHSEHNSLVRDGLYEKVAAFLTRVHLQRR